MLKIKSMPTKLKVGSVKYDVVEVPEIILDGFNAYYGLWSDMDAKISIREDLAEQRKKLTFVHELVHAMLSEANLSHINEEMVVEPLSRVLLQVLRENDLDWLRKD